MGSVGVADQAKLAADASENAEANNEERRVSRDPSGANAGAGR